METQLMVSVSEAAARLGVSRSTLYELIGENAIPFVKIGRTYRIPVDQLREWVTARTEATPTAAAS